MLTPARGSFFCIVLVITSLIGSNVLGQQPPADCTREKLQEEDCSNTVTGEFRYKLKKCKSVLRWTQVDSTKFERCVVYNPDTCENELVQEKVVIKTWQLLPTPVNYKVVRCVKLRVPVEPGTVEIPSALESTNFAEFKKLGECDCDLCEQLSEPEPVDEGPQDRPADLTLNTARRPERIGGDFVANTRAAGTHETQLLNSKPLAKTVDVGLALENDAATSLRVAGVTKTSRGSQILLRNVGHRDIHLQELSFSPNSVVPNTAHSSSASTDDFSGVPVYLTDADNQSSDSRKHGNYRKSMRDVIVPAGDTVALNVNILNPHHLGWALEGELKLTSDAADVKIPECQIHFVPRTISSRIALR